MQASKAAEGGKQGSRGGQQRRVKQAQAEEGQAESRQQQRGGGKNAIKCKW
jgi:hypothetical protein